MYCVADMGQKCQNIAIYDQNFHTFGDSCAHPLYRYGPNLARESRPMVYAYMPSFIWIRLLHHLPKMQKPQFWAISDILGSCNQRPLPMRAKYDMLEYSHSLCSCAKFRLDQFILSPSSSKKPPNFAVFWTSMFSGVTSQWQKENVEHECTSTNIPLSNSIKIVSVFQHLHGEIVRINSVIQKHNRYTNTQI